MARPRKYNHHLPPRVYKKHGAYYFVSVDKKWTRLARVGEEQLMRTKWAALNDPIESAGTMAALLDQYLSEYAANNKAPRTFKDNLNEAEYLKAFFGEMPPHQIMPHHVRSYLDANAATRPVRANREKALLSHVFTWAIQQPNWSINIKENPCKSVTGNKESKRINIVTDSDYNGLYEHANKNLQRLMTLIYRTLQRPSDILQMKFQGITQDKVDGQAVEILNCLQNKTGTWVKIIITPDLRLALFDKSYSQNTYLITNNKGKPYTLDGMNSLLAQARKRYAKAHFKKYGFNPKSFSLYDIKGKGATDMYQSGVPLEQIQLLAGHESVRTTEIYVKEKIITPVMPNTRKIKGA